MDRVVLSSVLDSGSVSKYHANRVRNATAGKSPFQVSEDTRGLSEDTLDCLRIAQESSFAHPSGPADPANARQHCFRPLFVQLVHGLQLPCPVRNLEPETNTAENLAREPIMFSSNDSTRPRPVFFLITLILMFILGAAAMPAFAVDPEEADPDPELTSPQEIVLSDPADLDTSSLAPGRYIVRIVDAEGATVSVYEIVVE